MQIQFSGSISRNTFGNKSKLKCDKSWPGAQARRDIAGFEARGNETAAERNAREARATALREKRCGLEGAMADMERDVRDQLNWDRVDAIYAKIREATGLKPLRRKWGWRK